MIFLFQLFHLLQIFLIYPIAFNLKILTNYCINKLHLQSISKVVRENIYKTRISFCRCTKCVLVIHGAEFLLIIC